MRRCSKDVIQEEIHYDDERDDGDKASPYLQPCMLLTILLVVDQPATGRNLRFDHFESFIHSHSNVYIGTVTRLNLFFPDRTDNIELDRIRKGIFY